MMKNFVFPLLLLTATMTYGQETFIIDDFSGDCYGKIYITDTTGISGNGWVAVYSKQTNRQLIKTEPDGIDFNLHNVRVEANVKKLPYEAQSLMIYEDFNFDGKNDFAIMDGRFSCYGGPSFQIYLATANGFRHSPEFTRLAQEYCGMFEVNPKDKKISTMSKSGCCSHEYSDFIVRDNKPVAVKIVNESLSMTGVTWDYVENNLVNGKMTEKIYSIFDAEKQQENVIYYFEFGNGKKMRLLNQYENLIYIFTDKDDIVEMDYNNSFYYSKDEVAVWFTKGNTTYRITPAGIIVTTPGKKWEMKAKQETVKGSLVTLQGIQFENVIFR